MAPEDVLSRLLNPGVVITMLISGIAYGALLWAYEIRPNVRLFAVACFPGAIFLIVIWTVRALQGVAATTYLVLLLDWWIFSLSGFHSVQVWRWIKRRRAA